MAYPMKSDQLFVRFELTQAIGDQQAAAESLRKFFEQKFGDTTDSFVSYPLCTCLADDECILCREMRQHAMLNLVRMHVSQGQHDPAKKVSLQSRPNRTEHVDKRIMNTASSRSYHRLTDGWR